MQQGDKIYAHGGNIYPYLERGEAPLDFSANVSPLGLSPAARAAAREALANAHLYPDPECRRLRAVLAEKLTEEATFSVSPSHAAGLSEKHAEKAGARKKHVKKRISPSQILCGNGAADLIYRLAFAVQPKAAVLAEPTFAEYERALAAAGCAEIRHFLLDAKENFLPSEAFLSEITEEVGLVFICNPNNPTGMLWPRDLLGKVWARCREVGAVLLVDECFLPFVARERQDSLLMAIACAEGSGGSLILLRAFTKFYGMAGLRLGYAVSNDEKLLMRMQNAGPPWGVSSVAEAAGVAALNDERYEERLAELVRTEREFLRAGLSNLGFRVLPGEANFLLFQADEELGPRLQERGILLRSCANFRGLDATWYRTAVRTREENERLLAEIYP